LRVIDFRVRNDSLTPFDINMFFKNRKKSHSPGDIQRTRTHTTHSHTHSCFVRRALPVMPRFSRFFLRNDKDNETRGFGVGMYNK